NFHRTRSPLELGLARASRGRRCHCPRRNIFYVEGICMICGPRHRRSITLAIAFLALLLPVRAEAHLPALGLGPVYDGIFHLFLSPEDLIPVVALALLAGQRGPAFARRVLWIVPIAWSTGGMIGMFAGAAPWPSMTFVSFLV